MIVDDKALLISHLFLAFNIISKVSNNLIINRMEIRYINKMEI